MICRLIPRRALARRLKVLFFAGFIFAIFHLLVIGIEYEAKILYTPEEEILHRVKRIHSTSSETPKTISAEPFKARIVIAKVSENRVLILTKIQYHFCYISSDQSEWNFSFEKNSILFLSLHLLQLQHHPVQQSRKLLQQLWKKNVQLGGKFYS